MSGSVLRLRLEAVALRGPGLPGWAASRPILAGAQPYHPAPIALEPPPQLSPAERRRAVPSVRLALAVGSEAVATAGHDPGAIAAVFAASGPDGETIAAILAALVTPAREVSPTRFHNSVHNAPSGYWSLAVRSREASTSISGHDASFAAGLLEAAVQAVSQQRPVLLVAYDLPYPAPLHEVRPIEGSFGAALVISPASSTGGHADLELTLLQDAAHAIDICADPALERLRAGNPAARSLPLLVRIARQEAGVVHLGFAHNVLRVRVCPR